MTTTSKLFWILSTAGAIALSITKCHGEINPEKLANAIYRAEGGAKAKSPYGVLSIKVKSEAEARRITLNSISRNYKRFVATGATYSDEAFINFMADRWCPRSADPIGNKNWKNNVTKIYVSNRN